MTEQVGTYASDEHLGRSRITYGYVVVRRVLGMTLAYAGLSVVLVITAIPFLWMAFGAFKTEIQLFEYPPGLWPNPWTAKNFPQLFAAIPFGHMFFNSWEISILATLGALISSAMAAYAFARLKFWGRNQLFISHAGYDDGAGAGHDDSGLHHHAQAGLDRHALAADRS